MKLWKPKAKTEYLFYLKELQNKTIQELIFVVEIKSDDDHDEVTSAKERYGKDHFRALNNKLLKSDLGNLERKYIEKSHQYYIFDLLTPSKYFSWFSAIEKGNVPIDWDIVGY